MATTQRPTRTPETLGGKTGYREEHPAYALIGASRVSSHPGATLYGSDARHQHYIIIRILKSSVSRHLSDDWYHGGGRQFIEVALTFAQWAEFISTLNVGEGIPCTVNYFNGVTMPYITPMESKTDEFTAEMREDLAEALASMEEALTEAKTKKQREAIEKAIRTLKSGTPFVAKQFEEHVEERLTKAKTEAEAYFGMMVHRAGITALGGEPPALIERDAAPLEIEAGAEATTQ